MIHLRADSRLARWFLFCCKLGFAIKPGAHYLANGTTLCHIAWVTFWFPLIAVAVFSLLATTFVLTHLMLHDEFVSGYGELAQNTAVFYASYFLLEGIILAIVAVAGMIILACIGGNKVGFFRLLVQYVRALKQRICPLVRFEDDASAAR